jgi:subtilisin family serine protease
MDHEQPGNRALEGARLARRAFLVAAAILAAGALALIGTPSGHADGPPAAKILVKFEPGVDGKSVVKGKGDDPAATTKTHVVEVKVKPGETTAEALAAYGADPQVAYAEPDVTYSAALDPPNDASFPSQWALSRIQALAGWAGYPGTYTAQGGAPVAVVDTGVDSSVADLSDGRVLTASGADCLSGSCVPDAAADGNGHGTEVAGVIDAAPNNGVGIAGEAFSSPVIPVRVLDANANGTASSIATGIIWAADHGARVVNLSLSGPYSQTICDAVTYAVNAGAVVVAAAGNNGWSTATYPAACPGAIGVAATDSNDNIPYWSNFGSPNVFLSAPGVSILTTARGGGYTTVDGTSLAAPYASGLAALLFSQDPLRTASVVKTILAETADKVGTAGYGADPYSTCATCTWNGSYGYGRIDVANGLAYSGPRFGVALSGSTTATVVPGASAAYNVSVAIDAGHSGSVALSASGLPAGATATFTPGAFTSSGSAQLTIATTAATPTGTFPLTITAADGQTTRSVDATLTVTSADFSVSASPTAATVGRGKSTTVALSIGSVAGYSGSVGLSVTGLPTGATAAFSPTSVAAPGSSQLTLTTASTTPVGDYPLTVSASDGTTTHTTAVTLSVVVPDFTLSASPPSLTVQRAQSGSFGVSLAAVGGFTGTATLAVSGLPTGATGSFSAGSVPVPGSSTLTVKTAANTPAGSYTLTIKGTSGSLVHTATVTLAVVIPDFNLSASPDTATVTSGQSATYPVSVGVVNGFTGSIALTASGTPTGATVGYSPSSVSAPGTSTLTVKTAATTPGGTYTLTLTGKSSTNVTHTETVTLTVIAPDFAVSSSAGSATIQQGDSAVYPIAVDALNGFSGSIALTVSGSPTGATATFSPGSVAAPGGSTLTVKTTGTTAIGTYTLTVTGTSASKLTRTAKLTLVINPIGDFTMSSTSSTITVKRGGFFSPSLSLKSVNGFYANVAFSTIGLPTGMTATWTKTPLLVSGTTAVTNSVKLAATNTTTPGTYTVTLVGTAGPIVHTVTLTVVVT